MVRDGVARLLTMRFCDFAAKKVLILRSPPQAGVSKDSHTETARVRLLSCAIALLGGERSACAPLSSDLIRRYSLPSAASVI
jgi:hypothetical protein